MILWLDLFLQLFVQALAVMLAGVSTVVIVGLAALVAFRIYVAMPLRKRR